MNNSYNAFISYRHHPDDIKVAAQIHRRLEHYRIPKANRKNGSSTLRLFRDKEELPITSNLTGEIYRALENSDFLIVICSPHTKQSLWVRREIETFLKTHSRDRVLTVLASGEPGEVLPDILLYEEVTDPVTGEKVRREYEPLSCDWRLKKRQAIREELPRLAAALLGCGYDELRQRQRHYRMRRTIALFAVALAASLALAAYYIRTSIQIQKANDDLQAANIQIQENLDRALQNQSEYLASAANERMSAGDRLTAISLALAALPSQENPRPYVPAAEWALSKALMSYESDYQVIAQGAFCTDAPVKQYMVSGDGGLLVMLDARKVLTVWDTETFQKRCTLSLAAHAPEQIYFTGSGNILVIAPKGLFCYQPDGTFLWQLEHCTDMAFLDQRSRILVIQNDYRDLLGYALVDADTGNITASIPILPQEQGSTPFGFLQLENDSSQPVLVRYSADRITYVYLLDLQTGTLRKVTAADSSYDGERQFVDCAALDADGNILVMRGDSSGIYNGDYGSYQITSPDRADLICYDARTLKVKWSSEITSYIYSGIRSIQSIPGSSRILVQSDDILQVHDSLTGQILSRCQLPAIALHLSVEETAAWGITQNGDHFRYNYADDQCRVTSFAQSTLDGAIVSGDYFIHTPLDFHVTVYRSMKDPDGIAYEETFPRSPAACRVQEDFLLMWDGSTVHLLDTRENRLLWQQPLQYHWKLLGISQDGSRFWMVNYFEDTLAEFSLKDGSRTDTTIPMALSGGYASLISDFFCSQDTLLYTLEADGAAYLLRMDLNTKDTSLCIPLQEDPDSGTIEFLMATDSHAWIRRSEEVSVVDLLTGEVRQILSGISLKPVCVWDDTHSTLMLTAGNKVVLAMEDGTISHTIELGDKKSVSVFFYGEELLVLCDDGDVYRYDRQGMLLSKTSLGLYDTFFQRISSSLSDPMDISWWITDDGDLIVKVFQAGNIIDCSLWQRRGLVPNLYTYIPQTDTFLCFSEEHFYAYPRYTTQQQVQKARSALGSFNLSEDQLQFYGLN